MLTVVRALRWAWGMGKASSMSARG